MKIHIDNMKIMRLKPSYLEKNSYSRNGKQHSHNKFKFFSKVPVDLCEYSQISKSYLKYRKEVYAKMDFSIHDNTLIRIILYAELVSAGIFHLDMGMYFKLVNSKDFYILS